MLFFQTQCRNSPWAPAPAWLRHRPRSPERPELHSEAPRILVSQAVSPTSGLCPTRGKCHGDSLLSSLSHLTGPQAKYMPAARAEQGAWRGGPRWPCQPACVSPQTGLLLGTQFGRLWGCFCSSRMFPPARTPRSQSRLLPKHFPSPSLAPGLPREALVRRWLQGTSRCSPWVT